MIDWFAWAIAWFMVMVIGLQVILLLATDRGLVTRTLDAFRRVMNKKERS